LAAKSEKLATMAQAAANRLKAQVLLETAKRNNDAKAITDANKMLAAGQTAVLNAEKALATDSTDYTPLSPMYPVTTSGRRKALAEWITSRDNPLTARVAVNHIWGRHFGMPLVETTFDFGRNGKRPSHPEMLDWLAVELMDSHWQMKRIHKLIVMSAAYAMSSYSTDARNELIDRNNVSLWRFPQRRMEAEVVRDSFIYLAGELDPTLGGPAIAQQHALTSRRRSLYLEHHGEERTEFLELFDVANPCDCYKRMSSILPQQALALANSDFARNAAVAIARRLTADSAHRSRSEREFIVAAFELVLSRPPTANEIELSAEFLKRQSATIAQRTPPAPDAGLAARGSLVHALFNHNDFVSIR
jgi:hypothetical protein